MVTVPFYQYNNLEIEKNEGIVIKLFEDIFESKKPEGFTYKMSCVEFKDNQVFDLLSVLVHQPSKVKDVSKRDIESYAEAEQMFREANLKRTAINDNGLLVHIGSFVVTIHIQNLLEDKVTHAKITIIELAGIGQSCFTLLSNRQNINANRTMLAFSQFLNHIRSVNNKREYNSDNSYKSASLPLLKYFYGSFLKQYTTLRLICHVRPEINCLISNITTLRLGETIRKVPSTETNIHSSHPNDQIDLIEKMTNLQSELLITEFLKGSTSMNFMTDNEIEKLKNIAREFLNSSDTINERQRSYAETSILLSTFKEELNNHFELNRHSKIDTVQFASEPFNLKGQPVMEEISVRQMIAEMEISIKDVLVPYSDLSLSKEKIWNTFKVENENLLNEHEKMVDEINAVFQKWTSVLENILTTQDRFFACRIDLYKIREQRHKIKIEVYDDNMNVIVPDKEKQLYRKVSQLETKLLEAYRNATLSKKTLNEILVKSLKFKNDMKKKFEEYVNIQKRKERREKMKASMSVRIAKSVRSFGPSMSRYLGMSKSNLLKKQSISDEDGLSVELDAVSTI